MALVSFSASPICTVALLIFSQDIYEYQDLEVLLWHWYWYPHSQRGDGRTDCWAQCFLNPDACFGIPVII